MLNMMQPLGYNSPFAKADLASGCQGVYLEHGARVHTGVHNDSPPLKCSDSQAEPHLSTLATICHSVFDVTVARETQRGLAYIFTNKETQDLNKR